MTKSMTGYGTVQAKLKQKVFSIEAKSVNHKFCEVNVKLPSRYSNLESNIIELAKSFFTRGRIDIFIREESRQSAPVKVNIDQAKLKYYVEELEVISKKLSLSFDRKLETLLSLPHVIMVEESEDTESFWKDLKPYLSKALENLEKMRIREGKAVGSYLSKEIKKLEDNRKEIMTLIPQGIEHHSKQLQERIRKLQADAGIDPQRLAQEIAFFIDRSDVSEELQRLEHHLEHFRSILKSSEPVGRKLDFLIQEINREVNTLSSKAQNSKISHLSVDSKHVLEKIREQVQNLE